MRPKVRRSVTDRHSDLVKREIRWCNGFFAKCVSLDYSRAKLAADGPCAKTYFPSVVCGIVCTLGLLAALVAAFTAPETRCYRDSAVHLTGDVGYLSSPAYPLRRDYQQEVRQQTDRKGRVLTSVALGAALRVLEVWRPWQGDSELS